MSVRSFKFVSPGVFINEIDNSFIPASAPLIGPVVIGRASRGLGMQPVTVESYSDFVRMFGDTVPGNGTGDVYRDGNYQSPMYGTYAAKAFLNAKVAPLTYVRLLGQQDANNDATTDAQAGWKTDNDVVEDGGLLGNGGAYGLWVFVSQSSNSTVNVGTQAQNIGTGSLAAIWYLNSGRIMLSGGMYGGAPISPEGNANTASLGAAIGTDSNGLFTVTITGSVNNSEETIQFNFDDSSENFVRKKFNTNPQLAASGSFYPPRTNGSGSERDYFLGESFEQDLRWKGLNTGVLMGVMMPIALVNTVSTGPHNLKGQASREARAGWFIGQDLGTPGSYVPFNQQKLFRLIGRGHGSWLQKNVKVSIEKIRASSTTSSEYGTFSVVLRQFTDTDNSVVILERFDNCNLDPSSPNYVARKIGNQYQTWDTTNLRLRLYGAYPNESRFVYVQMNDSVDQGASDATLLPFGYFAPPRFTNIVDVTASGSAAVSSFVTGGLVAQCGEKGNYVSGGIAVASYIQVSSRLTASFTFPSGNMRVSASDGGLSDPRNAYFGFSTSRDQTSTRSDKSAADWLNLLYVGFPDDPTAAYEPATGVRGWAEVFSMDNLSSSSDGTYVYQSGSRADGTSETSGSYVDLVDAGYDKFTAPFWGGFDGFDIKKPNPIYNKGIPGAGGSGAGTGTNLNSYVYYTIKRAIDTVADPEFIDMNLLTAPGVTQEGLTAHMVNVCEERADSLTIIDLPDVYIPPAEAYYSSITSRIGTTPTNAATNLRNRRIDSSYGCTFYPWVQTRDEQSGKLFWVPPSVVMMGVLASSEAKSAVWFAPAGFNRGGLSEGAAGIPVTGITERLTSRERDTLYESYINPIASFPSTGIVVFGQKTLQERQSALDRINVRRLVIYLKKQISILSTRILFEQNVQATWNRFKSLIEPLLSNVKTQFGITDYKLILDETTTTPDLIDQNILYAKIMIKPARAIEYIAIDFVIMSTGASFDD